VIPAMLASAPALSAPDSNELAPEVIIKPSEDGRIEEYRRNGKTFMIKVTPKKGRPYYLVDADGDGSLEKRTTEFSPEMLIPSWEILRW